MARKKAIKRKRGRGRRERKSKGDEGQIKKGVEGEYLFLRLFPPHLPLSFYLVPLTHDLYHRPRLPPLPHLLLLLISFLLRSHQIPN